MPAKHSIPLRKELHALALVDAKQPLRRVSKIIGVPKSTIHDNLEKYRSDVACYEKYQNPSQRELMKDILIVSMEGKTSSRDCANVLSKQKGKNISKDKVLSFLSEAGAVAQIKNIPQIPLHSVTSIDRPFFAPLSEVKAGAFDEIFQKRLPILGFVDPVSAYVFLQDSPDRSAESWKCFLTALRQMGLNIDSSITDGAQGMLKAISEIFPKAIQIRDLFHVFQKLSKAVKALEKYCYFLIRSCDKQREKGDDKEKQASLSSQMNKAILVFDALELENNLFKKACYFENNAGYIGSVEIRGIIKRIVALIECANRNGIHHSKMKDAKTYLQNAEEDIVAYKAAIEGFIEAKFGSANSHAVLGYICPIIECLDQVQRSYENLKRKEHWERKVVEARARFRHFDFIDQGEIDTAINSVAKMMGQIKKSNSLIECVNSVIRRFLVTYKSIPSWFCSLFTYYWNHRRFKRGKRKGLKPLEILTGRHSTADWIDELFRDHIFEDEKIENSSDKIALAG